MTVVFVNRSAVGAAQLNRVGDDSRQHSFEVQSRAYHLTDFAERLELAHRPCQLLGSLVQFLEQPHVLNGDHRLVGEGFQQLDLLRGKGTHLSRRTLSGVRWLPSPVTAKREQSENTRFVDPELASGISFSTAADISGHVSVPARRTQCGRWGSVPSTDRVRVEPHLQLARGIIATVDGCRQRLDDQSV